MLSSAKFNIREITKQLILLEDHLTEEEKFCVDCIRKHLMTVEGLAEEAVTMDPESPAVADCNMMISNSKRWMIKFSDGVRPTVIAQEVRLVRKNLMSKYFDPRL